MTVAGIPGAASDPAPVSRSLDDWLRWQEALHHNAVDMTLERVTTVLARLDVPRPTGGVFVVGGTNGKGSTTTLLSDILAAAGNRPGLYTSPHLLRYEERIRISGDTVAESELIGAFARIEQARGDVPLTYFEFGTLAALLCFVRAGCDYWVLEVGLGGRLDAVNAVPADVALITTIGLDHQEWLGDTLEAIAAEKAGILRPDRPALYGDQPLPAAIRDRAAFLGTDLRIMGRDFGFRSGEAPGEATCWEWWGRDRVVGGLVAQPRWTTAQYRNVSLALAALERIRPDLLTARGLNPVLARSGPPGRFQVVYREQEWVLDVAHNPQAARVLRSQLSTLPLPPGGRSATTVVTSLLADKAVREFVAELGDIAGRWIVSAVADPRASTEHRMRTEMAAAGISVVEWADSPEAAFQRAAEITPAGGRIVVCGSFRLVAPALRWLGLQ